MRKLIAATAVCIVLANIGTARAASVFYEFAGSVSSDVFSSFFPIPPIPPGPPYYPSTIPTNAVGAQFIGFITLSDANAAVITNSTFTGPLQNGQTASATLFFQGGSGPYNLMGIFGSQPEYATYASSSSGFALAVYGDQPRADRTQNNALFLTQSDTGFTSSLGVGSAGSSNFGRTLGFEVISVVPLPPALPLFASALVALVFVAFRQRRSANRRACLEC